MKTLAQMKSELKKNVMIHAWILFRTGKFDSFSTCLKRSWKTKKAALAKKAKTASKKYHKTRIISVPRTTPTVSRAQMEKQMGFEDFTKSYYA